MRKRCAHQVKTYLYCFCTYKYPHFAIRADNGFAKLSARIRADNVWDGDFARHGSVPITVSPDFRHGSVPITLAIL